MTNKSQNKKPEKSEKKRPAHLWKKGQSGNPGGMTAKHVAIRRSVRNALDEAFTRPDGTDELVEALVAGVRAGDATSLKLACAYRYGKPVDQTPEEAAQQRAAQLGSIEEVIIEMGKLVEAKKDGG